MCYLKVRLKQESLNEARSAPRKRPAAAGGGGGGGSGNGSGAPQGLSGDQWYSQSAMRAVNQVGLRIETCYGFNARWPAHVPVFKGRVALPQPLPTPVRITAHIRCCATLSSTLLLRSLRKCVLADLSPTAGGWARHPPPA